MKIFVGNMPFSMGEESLRSLFEPFGQISSATVVIDRESGRSRGFGFVEMNDEGEARRAMEELNNTEVDGRALVVNEARPRDDRRPPSGGRRGGSGGDRRHR